MKKLIALVLVVVLLVGMALPVSAARDIEYRPDLKSEVLQVIANAQALVPANYRSYYMVSYRGGVSWDIVFSTTPIINYGNAIKIYYSNSKQVYDYVYYGPDSALLAQGIAQYFTNSAKTERRSLNRVVLELSTAKFHDLEVYPYIVVSLQDPPPDKTALASLLTQANTKTDTGYTKSTWDRLQSSITSGQSVYSDADATQAQVDAAVSSLQQAIDSLLLLPTIPDLKSRITYAHSIENVGYTAESWQDMYSAIASGQSMLSTREYNQTQLTSADDLLNNAIDSLQLAVVTPPVVDPPSRDYSKIGTGEVTGFINGYERIFMDYVVTLFPGLIGLASILFGLRVVRKVFRNFGG